MIGSENLTKQIQESKSWFEVDKEGLKSLQLGKSKAYIPRELIQNAWDENITTCNVETSFRNEVATISVEDDNPEGFKDLRDSFTLFKHTYKRLDATKRGRFNLGEKQVIAICNQAMVETTKGTIIFNKDGRFATKFKRDKGSKVTVYINMTKEEYDEMIDSLQIYLTPKNVVTIINGRKLSYQEPFKIVQARLVTEIEDNNILKKTTRLTNVHIHNHKINGNTYIYEMGLPVMEIECQYDIDVQQKIPLNVDRETVSPSFLKSVFAIVLNATHEDLLPENSSQLWVREATTNKRIQKEALQSVLEKRYGEKVVVANPLDANSIDEAITHGYKVVYGNEMGKEEWHNIRQLDLIPSSTEVFGSSNSLADVKELENLDTNQRIVKAYAIKIANRILHHMKLQVRFVKSNESALALYCKNTKTLTFNISKLPRNFFDNYLETTSLILHELGHEFGNHTEHAYHEALTKMAQDLILLALQEPKFFQLEIEVEQR